MFVVPHLCGKVEQTAFDCEMLEFFIQYNLYRDSYVRTNENPVSCLSANLSYRKLAKINLKCQQEFITADAIQYLTLIVFKALPN